MSSKIPGRADAHLDLIADLLQSFAEGVRVRAMLPAGRRAEYLDAVEAMMIDLDRLDRYVTALDAERKRRGIDGTLLRAPALELPVEDVADRGLAALSDDELADLAIRPVALGCLFQFLHERMTEGRVGTMWWDAVSRLATEHAQAHRHLDAPQAAEGKSLPFTGNRATPPKTRTAVRWASRFVALAASLLIGVFLGTWNQRSGDDGSFLIGASMELLKSARGQASQLRITSPRTGFVAVVALLPGEPARPVVFPLWEDLPVEPGKPSATGPFPEDARPARVALVVVTRTPAADTLDKALSETMFSADETGRLETAVIRILKAKGHDRFALKSVVLR